MILYPCSVLPLSYQRKNPCFSLISVIRYSSRVFALCSSVRSSSHSSIPNALRHPAAMRSSSVYSKSYSGMSSGAPGQNPAPSVMRLPLHGLLGIKNGYRSQRARLYSFFTSIFVTSVICKFFASSEISAHIYSPSVKHLPCRFANNASSIGNHSISSPQSSISSSYTCMKSITLPYFSGNKLSQYSEITECGTIPT